MEIETKNDFSHIKRVIFTKEERIKKLYELAQEYRLEHKDDDLSDEDSNFPLYCFADDIVDKLKGSD